MNAQVDYLVARTEPRKEKVPAPCGRSCQQALPVPGVCSKVTGVQTMGAKKGFPEAKQLSWVLKDA